MYSVVLLMAVTSGGEAPEARGCRGGCRSSCGGCYVSCGGGGCAKAARRGKGCRGSSGCASYSGCYSCGYSGYSGCHSYGHSGYSSCHSYAYSAPATYAGCHAYAAPMTYPGCTGTVPSGGTEKKAIDGKNETTARITVTVPEGATVKIDGDSTLSTSTVRTFESPALAKGKTYSYTFVAEYQQSGQPVKVEKKVSFQAGSDVQLDLTKSGTAVASK